MCRRLLPALGTRPSGGWGSAVAACVAHHGRARAVARCDESRPRGCGALYPGPAPAGADFPPVEGAGGIVVGMVNSSKNKGDVNERAAHKLLIKSIPDLMDDVEKPIRAYGAGRRDDEGDLRMLSDTSIQVKAYQMKTLGTGLRQAADGAIRQAKNAGVPYGVGLVPIPGARTDGSQVRWLFSARPGVVSSDSVPGAVAEFKTISKLLQWVRTESLPGFIVHPRAARVGLLLGAGGDLLVGPMEAWVSRLREIRGIPDPGPEALAAKEAQVWARIEERSEGPRK